MAVSTLKPSHVDHEHVVALSEYLEDVGARIERDETFATRYNIDLMVTRFEGIFAHVNLGIHLNTTLDDVDNMQIFMQASRRGLVLKSIYIEMDDETIQAGGLQIAQGACLAYLFDRRHQQSRAVGLRVYEDCTFQFFELDEAVQRLQRASFEHDIQVGENMLGRIIAYFTDKGFGFIQTEEDHKYFFHIANIVDDELRMKLPSYVPGEVIPVEFQYGGNDGKKYPKAINVASKEEE